MVDFPVQFNGATTKDLDRCINTVVKLMITICVATFFGKQEVYIFLRCLVVKERYRPIRKKRCYLFTYQP